LTQVKQDLESAEKNFSEFASKNTALDIPTQGKAMIEATAGLEGEWIAAQTEIEGLKQVYADGNVRVRSTQARVDELRRQLEKNLGGKSGDPGSANAPIRQSLYPSIRELPVLGVGYADMFRNTKVQEAVFQTLTQEYELAKVQEAKETPSVKVLDPPDIPEKKSFPPRFLIMLLGTGFSLSAGIILVLGNAVWQGIDPSDVRKVLAQEILGAIHARVAWASPNGNIFGALRGKVWSWFRLSPAKSGTSR
jgi:capsule polysaccharide export protein KpsE/RkpR